MYPSHQLDRNRGNMPMDPLRAREIAQRGPLPDTRPSHMEMMEAAKQPSEAWPDWMRQNAFKGGAR